MAAVEQAETYTWKIWLKVHVNKLPNLNLIFMVPYILVTYAFIQFQLDVLYALFLSWEF
jgi:hypothetical protein